MDRSIYGKKDNPKEETMAYRGEPIEVRVEHLEEHMAKLRKETRDDISELGNRIELVSREHSRPWIEILGGRWDGEKLFRAFLGAIVIFAFAAIIAFVTYCAYKTATSSGRVEHCYFDKSEGGLFEEDRIILKGYRSWDTDVEYGTFRSTTEAVLAAHVANCPIGGK